MNKNKMRAISIGLIILTMLIIIIVYAVTNSDFNFKGNKFKQKQKAGLGYSRVGRVEFKSPDTFFLGDFTVNMATHDRAGKFVRIEVRLKMSDRDMVDELKFKNIVLRDAVIEEMSLKKFSEVSSETSKLNLKENLKNRLNGVLTEGEIEEIYFTKFIIQ